MLYINKKEAILHLNEYKKVPLSYIKIYEKSIDFLSTLIDTPEFMYIFFPPGVLPRYFTPSQIIVIVNLYRLLLKKELNIIKMLQESKKVVNSLKNQDFLPVNNIIIINDLFNLFYLIFNITEKIRQGEKDFVIYTNSFLLIRLSPENKEEIIKFMTSGCSFIPEKNFKIEILEK